MQPNQEPVRPYRAWVWAVVVLQVLVPAIMLVARWQDPSVGQVPFGWQMHTNCWGAETCPP